MWEACAGVPPDNVAQFSGLLPGLHTLHVRAVDPSLNFDATPATYSWTVLGPALTTITSDLVLDLEGNTQQGTATISFTSYQSGVTYM